MVGYVKRDTYIQNYTAYLLLPSRSENIEAIPNPQRRTLVFLPRKKVKIASLTLNSSLISR